MGEMPTGYLSDRCLCLIAAELIVDGGGVGRVAMSGLATRIPACKDSGLKENTSGVKHSIGCVTLHKCVAMGNLHILNQQITQELE